MDAADYLANDAVGLARLVASGQVSADELRLAATVRHEATHDAINAVVEWYDDPQPPRSTDDGVFAGVPFLRKDFGATEARRAVEMGSRLAARLVASTTSPYFERMAAAGVQVLGRTTVPEFAQHGTTESYANGVTRNPLDVTASAGGSSGGAAAAVRAGVVPIAHASDAAGSIRIPAAVTGLLGLKPSRDLIPPPVDTWRGLVTEFVIARSVRDIEAALTTLGAPGGAGPAAITDSERRPLRIALSLDHWAGGSTERAVVTAVEAAAVTLDAKGHRVESIGRPFDYERLMSTWFPLFAVGVADAIERVAAETGRTVDATTLEPNTLASLARVAALGPDALGDAEQARRDVTADLTASLSDHDLLLTPTLDRAVIPLGRMAGDCPMEEYLADGDEWFDRLYLANVTGWPAISVPAEVADEPPVGLQFMARPGREADLVAIARAVVGDSIVPPVDPR